MNRGGPGQTRQNKPRPKGSTVSNITLPRAPPPLPPPRTFIPEPPLSRLPVTSFANHAAQRPRANELYTGIENNSDLTPEELRITHPATAQPRASSLLVPFAPVPLNQAALGLGQTPTINWDNHMPGRPNISRVILTKSNGTKIAIREEICINIPSKSEKGIMHTCRVDGFRFSRSQDIPGPPKSIFVNLWKGTDWGTTRYELDSSFFNDINIVECPSITSGGKSRKSSRKNRSKSRKSRKNRRRH